MNAFGSSLKQIEALLRSYYPRSISAQAISPPREPESKTGTPFRRPSFSCAAPTVTIGGTAAREAGVPVSNASGPTGKIARKKAGCAERKENL